MNIFFAKDRSEWRKWLFEKYNNEPEINIRRLQENLAYLMMIPLRKRCVLVGLTDFRDQTILKVQSSVLLPGDQSLIGQN